MEKKESLKREDTISENDFVLKPKAPGISNRLFNIIKFLIGICFLPFVYASVAAFLNEFFKLDVALQNSFALGISSFLVLYLFIWVPQAIYVKGQKIVEFIFSFLRPLVRVAPYLIPIYAIIVTVIYAVMSLISKSAQLDQLFILLFGFTMALHLVFGAKSLRSKKEDFFRANYIFGFSFAFIADIVFTALVFNFVFSDFSFVNFANGFLDSAKAIFYAVFNQLFL